MNKFLTKRYDDIIIMAKRICKGSVESMDVAHYSIEQLMHHERGQELVDAKQAMQFLSGIMWRSFNSSTSQYHTLYRQKNRVHGFTSNHHLEAQDIDYNHEKDIVIGAIETCLEEMVIESIEQWFRSVFFQMYMETPNYSQLARKTGVPRTSIARAVEEAKEHIQLTLKNRGIEYDI